MKKTFIIAEAGVNHNGHLDLAYKLVDAAKEAGADAVKFQTFKAEKLASKRARQAEYQILNRDSSETFQLEMLKKLELKYEDFAKLKTYCNRVGITFLSTPFDFDSAESLCNLIDIYKIPSGEVINLPFLEYIAQKGKPIILSTGMSNLGEIERAVNLILESQPTLSSDFSPLTLLHCTTNYPTSFEEVNLRAMITMKHAFNLPVGYSDHTMGYEVSSAAVALGAEVIEKHFTLDRNLPGPDHKASLEPKELEQLVKAIRHIELAMGDGIKKPNQSEIEIMKAIRKSIVASRDLKAGEILTDEMITAKRAGTGIRPDELNYVLGRTLKREIAEDELLQWSDLI